MGTERAKIQFDLPAMRKFLRQVTALRGEEYAAQWLADEVYRQPGAFLKLLTTEDSPSGESLLSPSDREAVLQRLVSNVVVTARAAGFVRGRGEDDTACNAAEDVAVNELLSLAREAVQREAELGEALADGVERDGYIFVSVAKPTWERLAGSSSPSNAGRRADPSQPLDVPDAEPGFEMTFQRAVELGRAATALPAPPTQSGLPEPSETPK